MRKIVLSLVMGLGVGMAQADEAAVQGVIDAQIDAFKSDDFAQAFTYAHPSLRRLFGNPRNFARMVTQGYPMVHRPSSVEFLRSEGQGELWAQEVLIEDEQGRLHKLFYQMVSTEEGWKIGGVNLVTLPEVGA